VRMEADSDRPVKLLWRARSSAITTWLSRWAQRQQGRVHHTLTFHHHARVYDLTTPARWRASKQERQMALPTLVLFRRDLRVADNPALTAAMQAGAAVALYVLDDHADGRPLGGAARWWLHHALVRLEAELAAIGVPLILRRGPQNAEALTVAAVIGTGGIYWNRRYTPWGVATDTALKAEAKAKDITAESFASSYLREPWEIKTKQGGWFKVFTPFYKASLALGEPSAPLPVPPRQRSWSPAFPADRLEDWGLLPTKPDWAAGLRETWPAEAGAARVRLAQFLDEGVQNYGTARNRPDLDGTSALSPYLAFGELSPHQVWHAARHTQAAEPSKVGGADAFLRELVWRDFSTNLLYHFPELGERPFQPKFEAFPWRNDPAALHAWQKGETGYPWNDAGMRQLWHMGWMHNRVRMGVASFLTKHLLLPWQAGEAWFWDTLVDADPAQNIANWQWVAGCGADAAPYFRIFNPITQGAKFDETGAYLKRWQPGAANYEPGAAGVAPIAGHREARETALKAYQSLTVKR
ncbi:MAG: cryptochrome/photolyase family protein, partial [Alphaproteobacteria bacterium]